MMMMVMMMINDDDGDDDDDCHLFWKGADCFFFYGSSGYLELLIFSIMCNNPRVEGVGASQE